jgi:protein SCO1
MNRGFRKSVGAALLALWVAGASGALAADTAGQDPHYRLASWPAALPSPGFQLVDFDGHRRTLADYRGRITVVFFGFLSCPEVCPAEMLKFKLVMKQLQAVGDRVQVLFITLDPERDSPQSLKSYVRLFDPRFVGLTGTSSEIDAAARDFNVQYARIPTGQDYTINHSTATFIFDPLGHLRLVGSDRTSVADFAHDIAALAAQ